MRKLIVSIHLLLLFISCSEQKPSEYIEEIKIAGKVYSDNFSKTLNDVEVELKGDQVLMDTTDNEGNFLFFVQTKGQYSISLNKDLFLPVDTTLFISTDTTIVINLKDLSEKQKNQLTYLPLNEGNKWIYRKISTHRDGMYNITARDTMNTNLIIDKETDGIYSTDQNTFTTYHDQNKQIYIKKDLNSGQINIGYRIYFLFGEVGETIKINEQYSALRILSEEEVVWNSFETMRKAFKIYHAWDEETIYFLQGIGINRIVYEDEYNKSEFDLLAWEIDGIAYGDTTLLK